MYGLRTQCVDEQIKNSHFIILLEISTILNFELWHEQFLSATPLKLLKCLLLIVAGINDTVCWCAYIQKLPIQWLFIKMSAVLDKNFCFRFKKAYRSPWDIWAYFFFYQSAAMILSGVWSYYLHTHIYNQWRVTIFTYTSHLTDYCYTFIFGGRRKYRTHNMFILRCWKYRMHVYTVRRHWYILSDE